MGIDTVFGLTMLKIRLEVVFGDSEWYAERRWDG